jgi:hypothetical protein
MTPRMLEGNIAEIGEESAPGQIARTRASSEP